MSRNGQIGCSVIDAESIGVRPAFYIKEDTVFPTGDGSADTPYRGMIKYILYLPYIQQEYSVLYLFKIRLIIILQYTFIYQLTIYLLMGEISHTHTLTHYDGVAATCTESGTGEYWKCEGTESCGKMFGDEKSGNLYSRCLLQLFQ